MVTTRTTSKVTTLSASDKKLITKLGEAWQLDTKQSKLTGTFHFSRYLDAFMFVTRVSVHAEVQKIYPEITLTETSVTILLTNGTKKPVPTTLIQFASRIQQLFLSTPHHQA